MNHTSHQIRIIGQRRHDVDIERFADAIIAFAVHRQRTDGEPPAPEPRSSADAPEPSS